MARMYFALSLTTTLCAAIVLFGMVRVSAGERYAFANGAGTYFHGDYRGNLRPLYYPRPGVHVLPGRKNGPQLYYGYHHDHIPAYPVPVFRSYHPPVVYHRTIVPPADSAHIGWCYARYRSYRAYDNSFQPYHGPRKQCWSPYS